MEQYLDFVRNRTFRQTLLCHLDIKVDRALKPDELDRFFVAVPVVPVGEADMRAPGEMKFRHAISNRVIGISGPFLKAAMLCLSEVWPAGLSFGTLASRAEARAYREPIMSSDRLKRDSFQLGRWLLKGYLSGGVEFRSIKPSFNTAVGERPTASRLARLQSLLGNVVTNLRHDVANISDLARQILPHLDGTRDREALVKIVVDMVGQKKLLVVDATQHQAGSEPVICRETACDFAITELLGIQRTIGPQLAKAPQGLTTQLAGALDAALEGLARQALLTG